MKTGKGLFESPDMGVSKDCPLWGDVQAKVCEGDRREKGSEKGKGESFWWKYHEPAKCKSRERRNDPKRSDPASEKGGGGFKAM